MRVPDRTTGSEIIGRRLLAAAIAAVLLPLQAQAVWEAVPEAEMAVETNDNTRLEPETGAELQESSRTYVDARVRFANFAERGNIFVEPRARADSYADERDAELESTDVFLRSAGSYSWPVVGIGFSTYFADQSILSAELTDAVPDDPDLDDPIDPDTGRLGIFNETRERFDVYTYLDFTLSERNTIRFETQRLDVSYSAADISGRGSFDNTWLAAGIVRNLGERNQVTARLTASEYNAVRNNNTTDTFGVEGTFTRPLSPNWTLGINTGVSRSDYAFLNDDLEVVDNADTSFTYRVSFRRRTEFSTWNFDIGRRVDPNANGFLVERDEIRMYVRQQLSVRFSGTLALRFTENAVVDEVRLTEDREYGRLELDLEWALNERWYLAFGYDYRLQDYVNELTGNTESNAIYFGVGFSGLSQR